MTGLFSLLYAYNHGRLAYGHRPQYNSFDNQSPLLISVWAQDKHMRTVLVAAVQAQGQSSCCNMG